MSYFPEITRSDVPYISKYFKSKSLSKSGRGDPFIPFEVSCRLLLEGLRIRNLPFPSSIQVSSPY